MEMQKTSLLINDQSQESSSRWKFKPKTSQTKHFLEWVSLANHYTIKDINVQEEKK